MISRRLWTIVPNWDNDPKLRNLDLAGWEKFRYVFGRSNTGGSSLRLLSESEAPLNDILWYANARIVSTNVREALAQFSAGLEFYDVEIEWKGTVREYSILNVLTRLDCVDLRNSDCDLLNGYITRLRRLTLKETFDPDVPIFLVDRSAVQVIAMDERVVGALKAVNCTGAVFVGLTQFAN